MREPELRARGRTFQNPRKCARQFIGAAQIARLSEEGKVEREDVLAAIDDLRSIYEFLVTDRAAP